MPTPRKALENHKGRKSQAKKDAASKAPVGLGEPIKDMPVEIGIDKVAAERWKSIMAAYKGVYVPTTGDLSALIRLCQLYSEESAIRVAAVATDNPLGTLELHKLMDSKRRLIVPLEDRLFLNPAARMRGLPQKPKAESSDELENAKKNFPGVF